MNERTLTVIALCSVMLMLVPYATNGLWADDALNSQLYFGLERLNRGLFEFSAMVFDRWLTQYGRLMAGFFYSYPLFYIFHEVTALRLASCFAVIGSVIIWSIVLGRAGVSRILLIAWVVLVVGLFQINGVNSDPVGGFAFHYPILSLQLSICVLLLLWSLEKQSQINRILICLSVWFVFMFSYEMNFIFIPMAFILIWNRFGSKARSWYVLLGLYSVLYLLLLILVKLMAGGAYGEYAGAKPNINLSVFLAYFKQLSGSLPASAYFLNLRGSFGLADLVAASSRSAIAWAVLVGSFWVLHTSTKYQVVQRIPRGNLREGVLLSACMLFLPPIFIAISAGYQSMVKWGAPIIPVYYQWFGLAFFAALLLSWVSQFRWLHIILVLSLSIYMALNVTANFRTAEALDVYFKLPRQALRGFGENSGFSLLKNGDVVVIGRNVPHYVNANIIFEVSGLSVYVPSDDHTWFPEFPATDASSYELTYENRVYSLNKIKVAHQFSYGWSGLEDGHRWSENIESGIVIENFSSSEKNTIIRFGLRVLKPQNVTILLGHQIVFESFADEIVLLDVQIPYAFPSGRTDMKILTSVPPSSPDNGDSRSLSFDVVGLRFD